MRSASGACARNTASENNGAQSAAHGIDIIAFARKSAYRRIIINNRNNNQHVAEHQSIISTYQWPSAAHTAISIARAKSGVSSRSGKHLIKRHHRWRHMPVSKLS